MAGMRKKGDGWHCTLRVRCKRYGFATGSLTEQQARAKGVEADEALDLIGRAAINDLVAAGGKAPVLGGEPEISRDQFADGRAKGTRLG
jgi:hypothetical protein